MTPLTEPVHSAIRDHCQHTCSVPVLPSNFKILISCNSQIGLRILESLHIFKSSPSFNETNSCFPLHITQYSNSSSSPLFTSKFLCSPLFPTILYSAFFVKFLRSLILFRFFSSVLFILLLFFIFIHSISVLIIFQFI